MATSTLPARYKINGLINTERPVMENLESICVACGTFLSYDVQQGKWAVIINRVGTSQALFNDSNILGPIQVSGTGLRDLYNSVTVEYPLRDTVDQTDFVTVSIPAGDRFANEPDNELKITMSMCNEPVQAQLLALIELKQSRIDRIVTFNTDYSMLSLNAGDIITVTNTLYGFNSAPFRVITLKEVDTDDGSIQIEITALQYDANVYSTADLTRYIRSDRNGIIGIGAIAQPIPPVLYVFPQDQRPGIQVEAVVPAGIIERMELYISSDGSNYNWLQNFLAPPGGTLTPGDTVLFDYDSLDSQNIYVKVRGMNSTTAGPFSVADSFLSFVPLQVTGAVTQDAPLVQNGTGNLLTALALSKIAGWAFSSVGPSTFGNVMASTGQNANSFTRDSGSSATTTVTISSYTYSAAATDSGINAYAGTATLAGFTGSGSYALNFPITVPYSGSALLVLLESAYGSFSYQVVEAVSGTNQISTILAYYPMLVRVFKGATMIKEGTVDWQTQSTQFLITPSEVSGGSFTGSWSVKYIPIPTYDLNMDNPYHSAPEIYCYNMAAARTTAVTFQLIQ